MSRTGADHTSGGSRAGEEPAHQARRALVATGVANAVEWYDFAVFGASAVVLARVFFPTAGHSTGLALTFAVFATSFLARPLGALVIGVRADRLGRRRTLVATVATMSVATVVIGLLPSALDGAVAALFLVLCRLLQGFAAGGEISSSVPFVIEYAPPGRRGTFAGWHLAGVTAGLAAGTATVLVVAGLLPAGAFETWGWRVPFLLAAPLGLVGFYLRLTLDETPLFRHVVPLAEGYILHEVLRTHWRACLRGLAAVVALSVSFNTWFVFLPNHLIIQGDRSPLEALGCTVLGLVVAGVTAPVAGRLSDGIGRRRVLVLSMTGVTLLAVPGFLLASADSLTLLVLANCALGVAIGAMVIPAFVSEPFPTRLRATGVACSFGLGSAIFGGTAPLVGTVLSDRFPGWGVPVYVMCAAALGALAVVKAPETAFRALGDLGDLTRITHGRVGPDHPH